MIPVPKMFAVDVAFGNIKHLPAYETVPDNFKQWDDPYHKLIQTWFGAGVPETVFAKPKEGVVKEDAIAAMAAIMRNWEPKHEHKIAGVAYLFSEWFELP